MPKEAPDSDRVSQGGLLGEGKMCITFCPTSLKWNAFHSSQLMLHFSPLFFLGQAQFSDMNVSYKWVFHWSEK